jgi:phosphoribosylanthranilate isomerase
MKPRIKICCITSLDEALMAIESVHPFAVDVFSGVRTDGKLDKHKVLDFILKASDI